MADHPRTRSDSPPSTRAPAAHYTLLTPELKTQLIDLIAQAKVGNLTAAAARLNVARETVYAHLRQDPDFKAALEQARTSCVEHVEDWMLQAGRDLKAGFLPRMAWLKAHHREKWGEKPVQAGQLVVNILQVSSDQVSQIAAIEATFSPLLGIAPDPQLDQDPNPFDIPQTPTTHMEEENA